MSLTATAPMHAEEKPSTAIIFVAAISCLVVTLQQTLIIPAVPQLPRILNTTPTLVSWSVTATLLTGSIATPILSRLADTAGKKKMMVLSMVLVLLGSVIAPFGGIVTVIIGRALQGAGTALVPVAMSTMRDELPVDRMAGAIALLSATLGIGGGTGIPLGGVFLALWGWESLFWISAGLAALSIVLIVFFIPSRAPRTRHPFDFFGALLLSLALLLLLIGVSQGSAWGWGSPLIWGALLLGLAVAIGFVFFEIGHETPLVDMEVNSQRPVLLTNIASLAMGISMFTNLLVTTLHLQGSTAEHGFNQPASIAGLAMIPSAAIMFLMPKITEILVKKYGPEAVLIGGGVLTASAYLLRALASFNVTMVIVWAMVASAGVALTYAVFPLLIMANAPHHHTAAANGLNALVRAIGTAVSSAVVAAISVAFAVDHGGTSVTSWMGILSIFGVGAVVSLIASLCGVMIKKSERKAHHE